jgi:hypothetical protein
VARKAFAFYAHLPVHHGPAPAGTSSAPQPTSTPFPVPTSTPVPTQTGASVPVSTTYQAAIPGASVVLGTSANATDGSTMYMYNVTWTDSGPATVSFYVLSVNNPTTSGATAASTSVLSTMQRSLIGGTPQTSTNGSYWVVQEIGTTACRVVTGTAIGTTALVVGSVAADCGTATARNTSIVASLSTIVTA